MTTDRIRATGMLAIFIALTAGMAHAAGTKNETKGSMEDRILTVMQDPGAKTAAARAGRKTATFCANCHGESGNSSRPDVPNLAGQNPAYLLEQVRKFSDGRRRNDFMEGMIKAMSDEEKLNVVVYFSGQEVKPHPSPNPALASRGKELFHKICQRCHGEQGRGNDKIARIAGQQPDYLQLSLKRYRDGKGERADPAMAANTRNLTDADINSLVAFVSAMN